MDDKKLRKTWGISLIIIGIISIIISVISLADIAVSDWAKRILGLTDMIMLVIVSFTTVKIFRKR